ncbi:glucose-6-phosphate isomerase [Izhakiella australiensis]|uniref:Glucose-6-phosphate isomerase n=1 Tax=Izhakiella australiensis TaxID=1926881 RepID=A0A1S8YHZ5_9GAMM|nr:glucose-6-phosphate isomerase [Izhakiella australiensis]OON38690.1 glucose-6-phosphate isomerase [Izhakiella australiensis]
MKWVEPISCQVDLQQGLMHNASGHYQKRLSDLAGLYADDAAFKAELSHGGDRVVYEVTEWRPPARSGDMIFGLTRMSPGKIGEEFYLTRGHIHAVADRPEIYYGQRGEGLMLLESPDGETRIVEINAQTVCYVPPYWIHRSVNTGSDEFVMLFSYPADAGQDYDIIAHSGGMRRRIMADGTGGWKQVDNAAWQARSAQTVAKLLDQQSAGVTL